jgi:hypothetical protein
MLVFLLAIGSGPRSSLEARASSQIGALVEFLSTYGLTAIQSAG